MNKADLLRKFYEDVWVKNNLDAIDLYFSANAEAGGIIPEMSFGPDEFRELVFAVRNLLGEIDIDMPIVIENGEWAAGIIKARTSRADNGAPVEVTGQTMARFEGDKLVEAYNQFDYVSLFEQLGQLPPDTLPICMTGQRLAWA
ncbi:ester cyclase [Sedimentitalea nanhaiensis]|uniref:SnoaL-like polyketide cyclase n=1 Tax=Sedimentitalea nanhaiensis TaxID=999627 RepID=A0A1I7DZX5_9RHOB|nr:ester cyclase [Sedimentitalea nanhaiensis]SFU17249.1 SnoaL-like polyketide cyclase [Sedimentitalea nanhaiensis]